MGKAEHWSSRPGWLKALRPQNGIKSGLWQGEAKLFAHNGSDGKQLADMPLPAAPQFDGLSSFNGRVYVSMVNDQVLCLEP